MNIKIFPLDKVVFDGVPVYLGMERSAVENAIGTGQLIGKRYYYYNNELAELLKQKNGGEVIDMEQGYSYSFSNISVGVYREIRPSDVLEMIEAMKIDGIPTEDNKDLAVDMRRANHWATIGVGVAGYYQR